MDLDVNATPVVETKVQCVTPGEQAIARAVNAFVACGVAPEAKSS
jgi:hypothetical protein